MKRKRSRIIAAAAVLGLVITGCGRGDADRGQESPEGLSNMGIDINNGVEGGTGKTAGDSDAGGRDGEGAAGNAGSSGGEDGPVTWQAAWFSLENAYTQVLQSDGAFYGLCDRNGGAQLDRIGRESLSVEGTVPLQDGALESGLAADREGNLYVPAAGEAPGLWKIDARSGSGEYEKIELEDCSDRNDLFLKGIGTDSQGYSYIWCGLMIPEVENRNGVESEVWHMADRVYVKDGQMKTVFYQDIADMSGVDVLYFQIDGQGRPGFLVKDQTEILLQEIDTANQKLREPERLGTAFDCFGMEDANIPEHLTYTGAGWLYCRDNRLYEFRYEEQEKVQVLDLTAYGLLSSDIVFLGKGEDQIDVVRRGEQSDSLELAVFTPGRTDKTIVSLGVTMAAQDLEAAVARFNRESAGYRVETVDYFSREGSYEDACEQLKLDVVTGKAPDIIAVSGVDYRIFSGKGVLADLYGFMEEDGECSKDMLVQSVLKACEEQGHLYSISPSFQIHTIWGYADVTGGKSGVTFSELLGILEDNGKDFNAIGGFSADEPVLTRLCSAAMDEFVDWETGTCEFDGAYFKEVLSFAKNYHPAGGDWSYLQGIRNREQVLTAGMISSVADYQLEKVIYGGNLGFLGYPGAGGSGTAMDFRDSAVAVNGRSRNQEGAWEFVKFYLLQGYDGQGFPMVQERFDEVMEAAMQEAYADSEESGSENNSQRERMPKAYYGDGDDSVAVYAATRAEVEAVLELVESVENRFELHADIQNIINEEAEGYFSGQMDLDSTVDKMQNRVSLLLQEAR